MRRPYFVLLLLLLTAPAQAQEPADWSQDLVFSTFSIAAVDTATGESGVAVTTRVPCVGNGVPWVRAGVGAVATQASTLVAYGPDVLDLMAEGLSPAEALAQRMRTDSLQARRQVGVVALDGQTAQHTGTDTYAWAGHRGGFGYSVQGNLLVDSTVVEAVAQTFEASQGSTRHLADRLIEALEAGQAAGGDARKGRLQSAAVMVADPRENRSRRPDGLTVQINVCEHPTPVAEVRRVYTTISRTLGYRTLEQQGGNDVWQLKVILHALGYYRPDLDQLERSGAWRRYDEETVAAVERFRSDQNLATSRVGVPRGLVDAETVARLWEALEAAGRAQEVRDRLLEVTAVRR